MEGVGFSTLIISKTFIFHDADHDAIWINMMLDCAYSLIETLTDNHDNHPWKLETLTGNQYG